MYDEIFKLDKDDLVLNLMMLEIGYVCVVCGKIYFRVVWFKKVFVKEICFCFFRFWNM